MANRKIPIVLTPCPPSKQCPICYARMVQSEQWYGKPKPVETKVENGQPA